MDRSLRGGTSSVTGLEQSVREQFVETLMVKYRRIFPYSLSFSGPNEMHQWLSTSLVIRISFPSEHWRPYRLYATLECIKGLE